MKQGDIIVTVDSGDEVGIKYKIPGIWALWGHKDNKSFCLEVGETVNIKKEINQNLNIIRNDDSNFCKTLCLYKTYPARIKFLVLNLKIQVKDFSFIHAKGAITYPMELENILLKEIQDELINTKICLLKDT